MMLCPQIPLLFMGEESASRTPFLFFTDHHAELADAVREGRRNEFAKFPAFADPASRERIPDPNAPETFAASVPHADPVLGPAREALYRRLIALRATAIVPRLDGARALTAEVIGPKAVVARWRLGDGAILTLASNLDADAVPLDLPASQPAVCQRGQCRTADCRATAPAPSSMSLGRPMSDEAIRDLAHRAGIAVEWHDVTGRQRTVAPDVLRHMLEALGLPCATRGDLLASRRLLQRRSTVQALPPLITATAGRPTRLDVGANEPVGARLSLEAGGTRGRPALVRCADACACRRSACPAIIGC